VLGFSAIVERWGWLLLTVVLALVAGLAWTVMAQDRSPLAARFARRLPFRRLRLQYRGAQLLAVLGMLLTNGLTVVDALPLTARATRSKEWQYYLLGAERAVREGNSLSTALSREPLLPTTAIRLLEVGERGGSLGHTCLKASTIMAEAAKARIDRIVSLANPIAIILLGALVAMLVAGVMLGIFSMGDFVQ
jgi:type II secretory pathway component PulF